MIYVVNADILPDDDKYFEDYSDEEIIELSEKDPFLVDIYDDINHLARAWNNDDISYPSNSYIRVIE